METLEQLQMRHRKEQRELQARVTQKKKGATKKTRKGVNEECDNLERELKEKQEQELANLEGDGVPDVEDVPELEEEEEETRDNDMNGLAEEAQKATISEPAPSEDGQPRKRNRAKERLARRAAEQEAAVAEAKKEAASQPDQREVERKRLLADFELKGLTEKVIRPDGHCLFSAVADQLSQAGIPLNPGNEEVAENERYKVVRHAAAKYIQGHPDDFVAWLDEPLEDYVHKIRDTAEWGGHLELLALAKTYNVEICVLQNGPPQNIEPGLDGQEPGKIWLAYYRHGFGLGEHYNSLRKRPS
ncbi:OTU-like cysteine protease [Coleophoma cylindrospora]|uniref:OTU-like cysteine protease n=1 Tax=Coleophoma cylindrospora TaxID=1849047 RepID=A0A3D8QGG4_9HELO|nr:OTU-like cysteine protease [Coleophoma cylindrospora]